MQHDGSKTHKTGGTIHDQFFASKKPWSKVKDQVLESYLVPYLKKVRKLGKHIILVDGFAGRGRFDDGTIGSPLIMCRTADSIVPGSYTAIFANRRPAHHRALEENLLGVQPTGDVRTVAKRAEIVLGELATEVGNATVFIYLDPFGLVEYNALEPFLTRDTSYSTEIVLNLNAAVMHRLAARHVMNSSSPEVKRRNAKLNAVLGGDYWKPIFQDNGLLPSQKVERVMEAYRRKISTHLRYTGSCPVRECAGGPIKYFITFCSRHQHAMVLMNDAMFKAYNQRMHEADTAGMLPGLFPSWREYRHYIEPPPTSLSDAIVQQVHQTPGRSRLEVWVEIIEKYFMAFDQVEYRAAVDSLVDNGVLRMVDTKRTGKMNDESLLHLRGNANAEPYKRMEQNG